MRAVLLAGCIVLGQSALMGAAAPGAAGAVQQRVAVRDVAAAQERLMAFNTALERTNAQPGHVASVDAPNVGTVTVYLHGHPLTVEARALASKYHVTLHARSWPYSMQQLDAAARQAMASFRATGSASIGATTFDPGFAGVTVTVPAVSGAPAIRTAVQLASTGGSVPVRVKQTTSGAAASRDRDYSPYNAGDAMFAIDSDYRSHLCTSGFAVRYRGHNYVTTAQHCRTAGYRTLDDDVRTFGRTKKYSKAGQVRMMTATGGPVMWTGPWEGGSARTVVGARTVSIGDTVCDSGANSGSHCGITITGHDLFNDGSSTGSVLVGSVKKGIAIIQGDSGGPVYVPVPHSSTKVYAVGMIQEFLESNAHTNCGDVYDLGAGICSRTVGFTPIAHTLAGLGATLVTR